MADFSEHINQAKSNLNFLNSITSIKDYWDWKVTVSFYVALHLVNAHLAQKADLHYRTHNKVDQAINPFNTFSVTKFSEENYLAYTKLLGLSRRSRYLVNEKIRNNKNRLYFTYEKHFIKAIKNLDIILKYFNREYNVDFDKINIESEYYKSQTLNFFIP